MIEIHVKPGDVVAVDDPIVTLESDKATMDVPSTAAGVVRAVAVEAGDVVAEGRPLIEIEEPDAASSEQALPAAAPDVPEPAAEPEAAEEAPAEPETAGEAAPPAQSQGEGDTEVRVPDIGDATDVTVIEIHVKPGDVVAVDDPIVTLESDKATMDVPSTGAGTVASVLVAVGDTLAEGAALIALTADRGAAPVGETPSAGEGTADRPEPAPPAASAEPAEPAAPAPPAREGDDGPHASPLARRLARELGVDLATVTGTARNGRIGRDDVLAAAGAASSPSASGTDERDAGAAPSPAGPLAGLPPWPKVDFAKFGEIEVVPLTRIRKLAGANLHRNWVTIPHVTHHDEADVTELEAFRVRMNDERGKEGVKLTMVALLLKASVAALKEYPPSMPRSPATISC